MDQPTDRKPHEQVTPIVRVIGLDPPKVTLQDLILLEQFAGDLIQDLAASNDNGGETS